jgi:hypothetical protein
MSLCPHKFGWDYDTSRTRRWCLLCANQQRLLIVLNDDTPIWIGAERADSSPREGDGLRQGWAEAQSPMVLRRDSAAPLSRSVEQDGRTDPDSRSAERGPLDRRLPPRALRGVRAARLRLGLED